jgi:hypothetical protein
MHFANGISLRLRTVLGVFACATALSAAAASPARGAAAEDALTTTASAATFRDSVGVNAGNTWLDTNYGDWDRVNATLRELGVRHIRATLVITDNWGWNRYVYGLLQKSARAGIRFNLLVPFGCAPDGTMDPCLQALKTRVPLDSVESVEWPNEHDISGDPNWVSALSAWGRELYTKMKADAALQRIKVLGPSLVHPRSRSALGDQSAFLDRGNLHPYTGATSPRPDHMASERQLASLVSRDKPLVATEAGFHTSFAVPNGGHPPANERTAAVYTVRTALEHYISGIERTYIFQLLDWRNAPTDPDSNFGLLRHDWSPKPAFTALKNLLTMAGTTGPGNVSRLPYSLDGDTSDVRRLVLQKGDGSHLLILWRTASVYDRDNRQDLVVVPKRYTLTLPSAVNAEVGDPIHSDGFMPVGIDGAGRTVLDLGADPLVLRVRSPGLGAPADAVPAAGRGGAGPTVPAAQPPAATAQAAVDSRRPRVSRLRIRRVRRRYVAVFRLSEAARVVTRVDRARRGSRRTRFRTLKRLTPRQLRAGARRLSLGRLSRGRHRLVLTVRDAAGNRDGVARTFRGGAAGRR